MEHIAPLLIVQNSPLHVGGQSMTYYLFKLCTYCNHYKHINFAYFTNLNIFVDIHVV